MTEQINPTFHGTPEALASLFRKISTVMRDMPTLIKSGYNEDMDFFFVEQSNVFDQARELMGKYGLAILPSIMGSQIISTKASAKGHTTRVNFVFTLADSESGAIAVMPWQAESVDDTDKSLTKASAQALKYFLIRLFVISTREDDPDGSGKPANILATKDGAGHTMAQVKPTGPKDWTTYYTKTLPWFKITKADGATILKQVGDDCLKAFDLLKKDFEGQSTQPEQVELDGDGEPVTKAPYTREHFYNSIAKSIFDELTESMRVHIANIDPEKTAKAHSIDIEAAQMLFDLCKEYNDELDLMAELKADLDGEAGFNDELDELADEPNDDELDELADELKELELDESQEPEYIDDSDIE